MLDQFKQLKQLHEMQKMLNQVRIDVEHEGSKMILNGKMEILEINLADDLLSKDKEEVEDQIKKLHEIAMKKVQQEMAGKMGGMGGLM